MPYKPRKAITLAEIAMSLVVVAVVISALAATFQHVQSKRKLAAFMSELNHMYSVAAKMRATNSFYGFVDAGAIYALTPKQANERYWHAPSGTWFSAGYSSSTGAQYYFFWQLTPETCKAIFNYDWKARSVGFDSGQSWETRVTVDDCELDEQTFTKNKQLRITAWYDRGYS